MPARRSWPAWISGALLSAFATRGLAQEIEEDRERFHVVTQSHPDWFIKSDLSTIGATGLVPWENRVGALLGVQRYGQRFYLTTTPTFNATFDLRGEDLLLSLGAPLRFQLLDARGSDLDERLDGLMEFRTADWDEPTDFARLIRYLTYGHKHDPLYFNLSAFHTGTIGHGTLLRRYNPNITRQGQRVSLELDGYTDWLGAQSYVGDIVDPALLGALVFIKPLSLIDRDNYRLRSFSIGLTGALDPAAPLVNHLDLYDTDADGRRDELLLTGHGEVSSFTTPLLGRGVDVEMKVFRSRRGTSDYKLFADVSELLAEVPASCAEWTDAEQRLLCPALFDDDPIALDEQPVELETRDVTARGLTFGGVTRHTLGSFHRHALRTRLEARVYEPNYLPSYFDTFYAVERIHYAPSGVTPGDDIAGRTKLRAVLERTGDAPIWGGYGEVRYGFAEQFEVASGMGLAAGAPDGSLFFHVAVPRAQPIAIYASVYRTALAASDLFDIDRNTLMLLSARPRHPFGSPGRRVLPAHRLRRRHLAAADPRLQRGPGDLRAAQPGPRRARRALCRCAHRSLLAEADGGRRRLGLRREDPHRAGPRRAHRAQQYAARSARGGPQPPLLGAGGRGGRAGNGARGGLAGRGRAGGGPPAHGDSPGGSDRGVDGGEGRRGDPRRLVAGVPGRAAGVAVPGGL